MSSTTKLLNFYPGPTVLTIPCFNYSTAAYYAKAAQDGDYELVPEDSLFSNASWYVVKVDEKGELIVAN